MYNDMWIKTKEFNQFGYKMKYPWYYRLFYRYYERPYGTRGGKSYKREKRWL